MLIASRPPVEFHLCSQIGVCIYLVGIAISNFLVDSEGDRRAQGGERGGAEGFHHHFNSGIGERQDHVSVAL